MRIMTSCLFKFLLFYVTGLFITLPSVNRQQILTAAHTPGDEEMLLNNLTKRYNKNIRPVMNPSKAIDIEFDITFNYIIDVDEKHQIFISSVWIRQAWINELLTWDPKDFGGITTVTIPANQIWVPDIVLYNNVFEEFDGRFDNVNTLINLNHTGHNSWMAPFVFRTACKINVANFPFDKQICKLTFGSWAFMVDKINIVRMQNRTEAYQSTGKVENGEWELEKIPIETKEKKFDCCPHPYVYINFYVHLKRRYLFYIINLVIPNFLITLLAFLSFFIPVDSGERVSFVITVLLSMTVFLLLVAETIPPTSDAVPVIGIYFTSSIIQVSLALIATAVTLRIHHSHVLGRRALSRKLKVFLLEKLGPRVGFRTSGKSCEELQDEENENERSCVSCMKFFRKVRKHSSGSQSYDMCNKQNPNLKNENGFRQSSQIQELSCEDLKDNEKPIFTMQDEKVSLRFDTNYQQTTVYENVNLIAKTLKEHQETDIHIRECKLAAAIVDRTFMFLFVLVFFLSSCIILLLPTINKD